MITAGIDIGSITAKAALFAEKSYTEIMCHATGNIRKVR
ncbi:hypothetical protein ASZ90_006886 [hydrocarbon metagenome]|uniref:2-hydroxyglutaryl-CoA dehydratase n=1 Tax=hydrocarbon metagenome TaxID=938273 RepID=A0A0W8FRC6_9ZZZZ